MAKTPRVLLVSICLAAHASPGISLAQALPQGSLAPAPGPTRPSPAVEAGNPDRPSEGEAMACFGTSLSRLRLFEAVARACGVPLPERLADFTRRGVALGEARFEALHGVEAASRLRSAVDQSLARLDAEGLGVSCADASRKLLETEAGLFDAPGGRSAADELLGRLGTMIGRPLPGTFDCE